MKCPRCKSEFAKAFPCEEEGAIECGDCGHTHHCDMEERRDEIRDAFLAGMNYHTTREGGEMMRYIGMGTQISEDGRIEWRNNGGTIERRFLYASGQWERVAESPETPHTSAELRAMCAAGEYGYEA